MGIIVKVIVVGDGHGIILPKSLMKQANLKKGDVLKVEGDLILPDILTFTKIGNGNNQL